MIVRPWAKFTTDLPDDQIEDGPVIIQLAGKNVAGALAELLVGLGCEVSPPICANDNGWELHIVAGERRRRLWCQVTLIDEYEVFFGQNSMFAEMLGRNGQTYLDTLTRFASALAADPRFHNVRWYTSDDVWTEPVGAPWPIDGEIGSSEDRD